jgi:hypothetical protein
MKGDQARAGSTHHDGGVVGKVVPLMSHSSEAEKISHIVAEDDNYDTHPMSHLGEKKTPTTNMYGES